MKRKTLLFILLSVIVKGNAQTTITIDNIQYLIGGDTATIKKINYGFNNLNLSSITYQNKQYIITAVAERAAVTRSNYGIGLKGTLSLPNVRYIGERAFYGNPGLTSINLPNCVSMGISAFNTCNIDGSNLYAPKLETVGAGCFTSWTGDITLPKVKEIPTGFATFRSVSAPNATKVHDEAFYAPNPYSSDYIVSVDLPKCKTIGKQAFYRCENLTVMNLPEVESIDELAFKECTSLQSVEMPKITSLGYGTFNDCLALKTVSMPKIRIIGAQAFRSTALEEIGNIPEIKYIESLAFLHSNLHEITIPIDIEYLGVGCFFTNYSTLITVTDADNINEQGNKFMGHDLEQYNFQISEYASSYALNTNFYGSILEDGLYTTEYTKRMIVPEGKAALIINKWHFGDAEQARLEIYSPVTINKSGNGYNSLAISDSHPAGSILYNGEKYDNYYNFNYALNEVACRTTYGTGYWVSLFSGEYPYTYYIASSYKDNSTKDGTLTINKGSGGAPECLLKGPAAEVIYAPVTFSTYLNGIRNTKRGAWYTLRETHKDWDEYQALDNKYKNNREAMTEEELARHLELFHFFTYRSANTLALEAIESITYEIDKYKGTNYFKAGTGTAVAKESDGNYNFYFSGSMQAFYPCNNTVIPTDKAYLSLPKSMTANAKQITFVIDDNETTGIVDLSNDRYTMDGDGNLVPYCDSDIWHTLNGIRLNSKPTQKGIYLHNGRKEVVR